MTSQAATAACIRFSLHPTAQDVCPRHIILVTFEQLDFSNRILVAVVSLSM